MRAASRLTAARWTDRLAYLGLAPREVPVVVPLRRLLLRRVRVVLHIGEPLARSLAHGIALHSRMCALWHVRSKPQCTPARCRPKLRCGPPAWLTAYPVGHSATGMAHCLPCGPQCHRHGSLPTLWATVPPHGSLPTLWATVFYAPQWRTGDQYAWPQALHSKARGRQTSSDRRMCARWLVSSASVRCKPTPLAVASTCSACSSLADREWIGGRHSASAGACLYTAAHVAAPAARHVARGRRSARNGTRGRFGHNTWRGPTCRRASACEHYE